MKEIVQGNFISNAKVFLRGMGGEVPAEPSWWGDSRNESAG